MSATGVETSQVASQRNRTHKKYSRETWLKNVNLASNCRKELFFTALFYQGVNKAINRRQQTSFKTPIKRLREALFYLFQ